MKQSNNRYGNFNIYTCELNTGEQLIFSVNDPNNELAALVNVSLLLSGKCDIKITGSILSDNKVTPFEHNDILLSLIGLDTFRLYSTWIGSADVRLTAKEPTVYFCVNSNKKKLKYRIETTGQTKESDDVLIYSVPLTDKVIVVENNP
jgi:hypothetical protein